MNLNVITEQDAAAMGTVAAPAAPAGVVPKVSSDDLYSRLLKYIPAPVIGFYLMLTNLIIGASGKGEVSETLLWVILLLFGALTPAYLLRRKIRRPAQVIASVAAFLAFATASPGAFQFIDGWEPWYGTLVLVVAASLLVVFRPKPLPPEAGE